MKIYLVGGVVRDHLLGRDSSKSDIDFAVEAKSYEEMRNNLPRDGDKPIIFLERPEFVTLKARVPLPCDYGGILTRDSPTIVADFTLCRKDGFYSDARHPDNVDVGTLEDDLARRDFTMNAIAMSHDGELIDPHGGKNDIDRRVIRCVGNAYDRLYEDPLRVLRAIRFAVTLGMTIAPSIAYVLNDPALVNRLETVSIERVQGELHKAAKYDTPTLMRHLYERHHWVGRALEQYHNDIWFKPTLEKR